MSSESASVSKPAIDSPSKFRVVGIGASAGGLESLEQFFANLPPNPGMAFVVVQHLSPDFRSVMDELLSRHCDMPVRQAFLVEIVPEREDLPNAIALNSSLVNGARLIGPAIAGFLLAEAGEAVCFFGNAFDLSPRSLGKMLVEASLQASDLLDREGFPM